VIYDIYSDEQKKGRQVFREKIGVTPSVAAPGVTHPSNATDRMGPPPCSSVQLSRCTNSSQNVALGLHFCMPYLYQILTDFQNYFTVRVRRKFVIILSLKIPPHLKCVACEMSSVLKATIFVSLNFIKY